MKLDLSKFKKILSDKDSTTLQHDDGHIFKVAHNVLSKAGQSSLAAVRGKDDEETEEQKKKKYGKVMDPKGNKPQVYAEGGSVQDSINTFVDSFMGQAPKPERVSKEGGDATQKTITKRPSHRIYEKYAEGGDVEEAISYDPLAPVPSQDELAPDANLRYQTEVEQLKSDAPYMPEQLIDKQAVKNIQDEKLGVEREAAKREFATTMEQRDANKLAADKQALGISSPSPIVPETQPAGLAEQAPQEMASQPSMQQSEQGGIAQDPQMGGYASQMAGAQQEAKALEAQGIAEAKALDEDRVKRAEAGKAYDESVNELKQQAAAYHEDIKNGFISPDKYWTGWTAANGQKVEGHSKVGAIIGMLIAGFGGNTNAGQLFDKEIEQSMNAQKENLQSSHNLLKANMDQYKNLSDAQNVTRMQLQDDLINRMQKAAAVAKAPMAKAAMMKQIGELQLKQGELANKVALSQAITKLKNQSQPGSTGALELAIDKLETIDPQRAREMQAKLVPGVGLANTAEGAKGVRDMKTTTDTINQGVQRLKQLTQKTGKSLSLTDRAEADSIRTALIGRLREPITGPGAMSDGEREMLQNLIPDVTSFTSLDSISSKKLDTLEKTVNANYNNMLRSNGLAPTKQAPTKQAPNTSGLEGKTATNKAGEKIIFQNGGWHKVK